MVHWVVEVRRWIIQQRLFVMIASLLRRVQNQEQMQDAMHTGQQVETLGPIVRKARLLSQPIVQLVHMIKAFVGS